MVALTFPLQAVPQAEKSLYDHFSDAVVQNPIVGKTSQNSSLKAWHTKNLGRLPGLKFMRTLWVCEITGGPQKVSP